jgi:hypothetical protein
MASGSLKPPGAPRARMAALTLLLALALSGCTTESANRTATAEAGGTPATTITPSGNLLMIDDDVVRQVFVPIPQQGPLYALTAERLFIWRNREWQPTGARNDGRVHLVDHNNTDRIFRGNHPTCGHEQEHEPIRLEVSEDGGSTWKVLGNGNNVRPLAIDPVFPDVLYGTDCALTISTDLGETWYRVEPLANHEIIDLVVVGDRLLVLGISTQGKSQVRELRLPTPDQPEISDSIFQVEGIAALDADASRIVIGSRDGIQISLNGGQTWATSRSGLESVTVAPATDVTPMPTIQRPNPRFGILTVAIDPTRENRIFAGTVRGLYVSQDNGGTWDHYRAVDDHARVSDVQFALAGTDIFVTTDAGVVAVPNP